MGKIQQEQASVGILLGVRSDGGKAGVLLQVRADHDRYARACQVTTHGKLTEAELRLDEPQALATALGRKLREEIGTVAAEMVEALMVDAIELERIVNSKGRLVVTMGVDLNIQAVAFRKLIVPGKDVAGFRVCEDAAQIQPLEDCHKIFGVSNNETRMFRDEIEAVKTFFKRIFDRPASSSGSARAK
jgi:hypothetical protein